MATYKVLKGLTIQELSSDPGVLTKGEVWYNSTAETLKAVSQVGAWSTGGAQPSQQVGAASGGTQTAAWVCSGQAPGGSPSAPTETLFYNGTAWTDQSAALSVANTGYIGSTGTQASAILAGGTPVGSSTVAAEWGGSSWTTITAQPTGRRYVAGFGASGTSGYLAGGATWAGAGLTKTSEVNSWNGTSWTAENGLNDARLLSSGGSGTATTGIVIGGHVRPPHPGAYDTDLVEEFNGTTWTQGTVYPSAESSISSGGPQLSLIAYGSGPGSTDSFQFDGTTWTALASLATGRGAGGRSVSGTTSAQLFSGGTPNPGSSPGTQVEEYNLADAAVTFTAT